MTVVHVVREVARLIACHRTQRSSILWHVNWLLHVGLGPALRWHRTTERRGRGTVQSVSYGRHEVRGRSWWHHVARGWQTRTIHHVGWKSTWYSPPSS